MFDPGDVDPKDDLSLHTAISKLIAKLSETDEKFAMLTQEFRNSTCKKYESLYLYVEKKSKAQIIAHTQEESNAPHTESEDEASTQAGKISPSFGSGQKPEP